MHALFWKSYPMGFLFDEFSCFDWHQNKLRHFALKSVSDVLPTSKGENDVLPPPTPSMQCCATVWVTVVALLSRHPWNANKVSVTGAGLDVCIYLAFYSPESCKIFCLTCIPTKSVDTRFCSLLKLPKILPKSASIFLSFHKIILWRYIVINDQGLKLAIQLATYKYLLPVCLIWWWSKVRQISYIFYGLFVEKDSVITPLYYS